MVLQCQVCHSIAFKQFITKTVLYLQEGVDENDERNFYESSENSDVGSDDEEMSKKKMYVMDADHRLLLKTCKPLLNSRNGSVSPLFSQIKTFET